MTAWVVDLGRVDYAAAWALQLALVDRRRRGEVPDVLLLCEHDPVITLGRRQAAQRNVLDPRFPLFEVERGGDATYHGPGQLLGYPILQLDGAERDLHRYLRDLEAGLIELCAGCGVPAGRKDGFTGAWTAQGERKLASIGIAVRRWVTFHGFALNVATDLTHFRALNPCGLQATVMTSLAAEGGRIGAAPPTLAALIPAAIACMGAALRRDFVPTDAAALGLANVRL